MKISAKDVERAQAKAVGGKKDRCKKGKSCSATCISTWKACLVEMSASVSLAMDRAADKILYRATKLNKALEGEPRYYKLKLKLVKELEAAERQDDPRRFNRAGKALAKLEGQYGKRFKDGHLIFPKALPFEPKPVVLSRYPEEYDKALRNVRREGDRTFNGWKDSYPDPKFIGRGSYGHVIENPDGTYIKRGAISDTEASVMRRVGDKDLGPKLRAADINGPHATEKADFVNIVNGRIAMSRVDGKPINIYAPPDAKVEGKTVSDIYWKSMADLHRLGIAHNDAHPGNIMIDDKGKGRWVDFGLSQLSFKAALAEALGSFVVDDGGTATISRGSGRSLKSGGGGGNWQSAQWEPTGLPAYQRSLSLGRIKVDELKQELPNLGTILNNLEGVRSKLSGMGFTNSQVASIQLHGIRSRMESFNEGVWGRITEKQAKDLLEDLYQGI